MRVDESRELLERCAGGREREAWEELMSRYGLRLAHGVTRALRRTGRRMGRQDREDLLQEVYCRLMENRGRKLRRCRGTGDRSIGAYLARIAESVALDQLRSMAAEKRGGGRVVSLEHSAHGRRRPVGDRSASPEERLLAREKRRVFMERCRKAAGPKTTRRDLKILYLTFFEGLSSRQTARVIGGGISSNSVDSVIYRLRRRLADGGMELPRRRGDRL